MFGLFKVLISIPLAMGIFFPQLAWEMSGNWKYRDPVSGKAYLAMTRMISAIIFIILWLFMKV